MKPNTDVILKRDCPAVLIPHGAPLTLKAGTEVTVTQALGGTYTVLCPAGMVRIDGKDADALGVETAKPSPAAEVGVPQDRDSMMKTIWDQLKTVYDPEIPVNIVDLGLVYSLDLKQSEGGGWNVDVAMTLTAPGCGMGPVLQQDAQSRIMALQGVDAAKVDLVWDPPWHQDMITEAGKMKLGMI